MILGDLAKVEEKVGSLRHFHKEHARMQISERAYYHAEDGLCTYRGKESNRGSILLVCGWHGLVFGSLHDTSESGIDVRNNCSN